MSVRSILYRGPSMLDGRPIVVTFYTGTKNRKVGAGPSLSILPDAPTYREAFKAAPSVCGGCAFLGSMHPTGEKRQQGGCYSWALSMPIASQLKAIAAGRYVEGEAGWVLAEAHLRAHAPRIIRVATVGDSAAVPRWVWDRLRAACPDGTIPQNYSHQWRRPDAQHLRTWTMASVETEEDASKAQAMGWRTFRARLQDAPTTDAEKVCTHEAEKLTCSACRSCDGDGLAPSIVSTVHGNTATASKARAVVAAAIKRAARRAARRAA